MSKNQRYISLAANESGSIIDPDADHVGGNVQALSRDFDPDIGIVACAGAVIGATFFGAMLSAIAAAAGLVVFSLSPADVGAFLQSWGRQWGADIVTSGANGQFAAWISLAGLSSLLDAIGTFHSVRGSAISFAHRLRALRLVAVLIGSISILGGDALKRWAAQMIERGPWARFWAALLILGVALPLFLAATLGPWFVALWVMRPPALLVALTLLIKAIVLVPAALHLIYVAVRLASGNGGA